MKRPPSLDCLIITLYYSTSCLLTEAILNYEPSLLLNPGAILPSVNRGRLSDLLPGFLITLGLAAVSFLTWWFLKDTWLKFSALLWAYIFSIITTNFFPRLSSGSFTSGIDYASSRLLRVAIALLGLTVSASVWSKLGGIGIAVVLINLVFIFVFGFVFCRKILKLGGTLPILISVGTAICGASAVAGTSPAVKAKAEESGLSIAVITLFGLLAMFGYPLLFYGPLGDWLGNSPAAFGMWSGMGIHETAQVVAAGSQVEGGLGMAVSAKFIRIFMIGPMIFASLLVFRRVSGGESARARFPIPWFAVFFVVFTLIHLALESSPLRVSWAAVNSAFLSPLVTFLLAWSFAAIGLKVKVSAIRAIGLKAFLGGMVVAVVAGGTALLLVKFLWLPLYGA